MNIEKRFENALILQEHYREFSDFLVDAMEYLGFSTTSMQLNIGEFMSDEEIRLLMVMAQRGEAKTTIAAIYAVWCIIQRPSVITLIISAGEQMSKQISGLIVRLIMQWDILECYRPDIYHGDRTSVDAFDVHYSLKGINKSPSISNLSVGANLAGNRADILIADDVESDKNAITPMLRARVAAATKEFSAICTHGKILYLGTPHTEDSIYNTLPMRGFTVRIWPGRYPTVDDEEQYGDMLAPYIVEKMRADPSLQSGGGLDGTLGKPTDPLRYDEAALQEKELSYGPAGFQLQYMLNTRLSDEARRQLKLSDLVIANFGREAIPETVAYQATPKYMVQLPQDFPIPLAKMYYAVPSEEHFVKPKDILMVLDPASDHGSDETGYAIGTAVGAHIHVFDCGGILGGLSEKGAKRIVELCREYDVTRIIVESNMGHGLYEINLRAILEKEGLPVSQAVTGNYSTGQKERRIIESLVSPMQRHKVVIHEQVIKTDIECNKKHPLENRVHHSLFHQMSNITTDRNCLVHDDRLDALAMLVRSYKGVLATDTEKAVARRKEEELQEFLSNPMGYIDVPRNTNKFNSSNTVLSRYSNKRVNSKYRGTIHNIYKNNI